jgi:hypothetical protein
MNPYHVMSYIIVLGLLAALMTGRPDILIWLFLSLIAYALLIRKS